MSIVGPRPERPELAAEIEKEIPEFCYRLKMKAGLTGYAQVYGKYNTTSYDKLKLDLTYIRNYSSASRPEAHPDDTEDHDAQREYGRSRRQWKSF